MQYNAVLNLLQGGLLSFHILACHWTDSFGAWHLDCGPLSRWLGLKERSRLTKNPYKTDPSKTNAFLARIPDSPSFCFGSFGCWILIYFNPGLRTIWLPPCWARRRPLHWHPSMQCPGLALNQLDDGWPESEERCSEICKSADGIAWSIKREIYQDISEKKDIKNDI